MNAEEDKAGFTPVERFIDARARRLLARAPDNRLWRGLAEFLVFALKQAWACIFGAALLAVLFGTRLWYPTDAALARNDFVTIAAVIIQVSMIALRLETLRELRVIILFHIVGTGMELFKTSGGSPRFSPHSFTLTSSPITTSGTFAGSCSGESP